MQYLTHAQEMGLETPDVPSVFMKPANSLGDPFPAPTIIPAPFVKDDAADYEAEVALVIGKAAKNVSEEDAMDYLLGYVLTKLSNWGLIFQVHSSE
jgi:2-keto-4-pentenoate hydratase/2-oxohepta-3-ene-1,7-dioic acid hydratase in catechol pathway